MRKETLSVRVLGIRLVQGKTFGFARLADRGGDAFVSPPLMREVGEKVPPHAVAEMAEKGRRVVLFLDKPEVWFVWEGERDEERMVALVPEIARRWADFKEAHHGEICAISDYGHEEFSSLWSAACRAGEAGKFLARLEKEFLTPTKQAEVVHRTPRLFEEWKATLTERVEEVRAREVKSVREGYQHDSSETRYLLWWSEYTPAEMRMRLLAIVAPLTAETDRLCEAAKAELEATIAERKRSEALWREAEYARERHGVWQGLVLAGLDDLVSPDEPLKRWPMAGRYFPEREERTGELHATRWYRERREHEAQRLFDEACAVAHVPTTHQKWAGYFANTSSYRDGDGDWQTVDHGTSSVRYDTVPLPWAVEAVERILAADKAASFRADFPSLVAAELHRQMEVLDTETLSERNLPSAEESKLRLPESKEKLRRIRAEEARLQEEAKVAELRERGLREEEARLAAADKAEERRLLDIVSVRKDWERMLRWSFASGGYRSLHPEAKALLEEMRGKQEELRNVARNEEARRAEEAARQKQAEKKSFLGKGAWGALDGLKL